MISFFKIIIYTPLYNALVFILDVLPVADIGLSVIVLTLLVKVILYPLAKKTSVTQLQMKEHQSELDEIREKYKDNREAQALKTMEFYKKYKINPFSSFVTILIQIPIIYSLYHIFTYAGFPSVNSEMLYSFVQAPEVVSTNFLGLIDVASKNIFLAFLAAITSFFQMKITTPSPSPVVPGKKPDFKDDLSRVMSMQMRYFLPAIVFFVSWRISGVVALYWAVSNLLGIAQDLWIKKRLNFQKP
ncbi:MAG TPA: YidC/Oxa1 family membrane protein insertase [Candidatus Paceibacterota bacterium]